MRSIALFILVFASCGNPTVEKSGKVEQLDSNISASSTPVPGVDTSISGCFSQINGRDTAMFQVDVKGSAVTGPLSYQYYEKDRNEGTFMGELSEGRLAGWYLFKSEGLVSVRQVIFKINNGSLIPGMGKMMERGDSMIFSNPDIITFDESRPFRKVACML